MSKISRVIVLLAAVILIITYFTPLWKIELTAPQYPEGLVMKIWSFKLGGDVDIINGLNHYIGMGTMHDEDFIEFTILPYIIGFIILMGLLTSGVGNRKLLYGYASLIAVFGVVAMVDFYLWEYEYGHNLDPTAPIQVPGMSYQPPLIGYKKLLNFGAYSIPDTGGWVFILSAFAVIGASIYEWKTCCQKQTSKPTGTGSLAMGMVALAFITLSSCSRKPQELVMGQDQCDYCKMMIMDNRYGGEIMSKTGKPYKFDDVGCAVSFVSKKYIDQEKIDQTYLVDYFSGTLILADQAYILKSEQLKTPMGSNLAAFAIKDSLFILQSVKGGNLLSWPDAKEYCLSKEAICNL
jgi:copper chaperone NosL